MTHTRRQFIRFALVGATLLAVGGRAGKNLASGDVPPGRSTLQKGSPMTQNTEWKTVTVSDDTRMRVFVARPRERVEKAPGVLVLQEAFGVNAHIRDVAARIAELGYVAAAPELFHRTAAGFEGDYNNFQAV